ncbi:MAG: prepilin-type N-terminal cleavage/methylation domain-containing protein [Planctomycetota bacterium]|nr:prepilin-type N-terminal cleavage/methylation domain-containing protein [Planctomycetota bacterium]
MAYHRRLKGLTMTELMVVMTIMVILMGLLAHGLAPVRREQYVVEAANAVAGIMRMARSMAISRNAIYHVRIINRGPDDQCIGIWHFPKVTDALDADTEDKVIAQGGWNPNAYQSKGKPGVWEPDMNPLTGKPWTNYRVEIRKLDGGVWFETFGDLDPLEHPLAVNMKPADYNRLPNEEKARINAWRDRLAGRTRTGSDPGGYSYLYYDYDPDGLDGPSGPDDPNNRKRRLEKSASGMTYRHVNVLPRDSTGNSKLLFFMPDGTASANLSVCVRDGNSFRVVTVSKSGAIGISDEFVR